MTKPEAVTVWIDGKISTGKLCEVCEITRPSGDDLAGLIANEYQGRARKLLENMESRRLKCEQWAEEAKAEKKYHDAATELAKVNLYHALEFMVKDIFALHPKLNQSMTREYQL